MATPEKKHSKVEVGHGINVSNLDKMIAVLLSFGGQYAPSNTSISIAALQALYPILVACIKQVNDSTTVYVLDVDNRQDAFDMMNSTSTRALAILRGSGVTKRQIADAASIVKKLRGERVVTIEEAATEETPLLNPDDMETSKAGNELSTKVKRSVSQLSFDSRTEHLSELIKFLSSIPNYNPNEPDLTIAALTAYINTLSALNHNVNTSGSDLQKSRRERNVLLYGEVTGLLDLTRAVKSYVKGVFGYNAPETKEVNRIAFRDKA